LEVLFQFVEACGESSDLFEVRGGSLDAVWLAIQSFVEGSLYQAHAAGRDDGLDAAPGQIIEDRVGVVAFAGDHGFRLPLAQQNEGLGAVMRLATGEVEAGRQAQIVGQQVDLGRQTSSTPPQSGVRSPFFRAEAAC
jgi:hypothetical protein